MARRKVCLIYTGGTIGGRLAKPSQREYQPEVDIDLSPKHFFKKLDKRGLGVERGIEVEYGEHVGIYDLSEHLLPNDWLGVAQSILEARDKGADGVVVAHGTDTMAWTASALAFLLLGLDIPVLLTGSQKVLTQPSTDALKHLSDAVFVASHKELRGVFIVFAGDVHSHTLVHLGVRAQKDQHADSHYVSVHTKPVARVCPRWLFEWQTKLKITNRALLSESIKLNAKAHVDRDLRLRPDVALLKVYPGFPPQLLTHMADRGIKGIVMEAYDGGTGPACQQTGHKGHREHSLLGAIESLTKREIPVFFVSQHKGVVTMDAYGSAVKLRDAGAVPLGDMLPEPAVAKLMWALGRYREVGKVKEIMVENLCGEVTPQ